MQQSDNIFVIDRFEEGIAILENIVSAEILQEPKAKLPEGAREGDCVFMSDDGIWQMDLQETKQRAARIKAKQDKIFR